MNGSPEDRTRKRQEKQAGHLVRLAEHLKRAEAERERTEALMTARAIALAGLPKRKTGDRYLIRILRLGRKLWVRVVYSVNAPEGILPYGEDRFVLAGLQHLALEQQSPVVEFEEVGQLLRMFGLERDRQSYALLRQRLDRLAGLAIRLDFAETEDELLQPPAGESMRIIRRFRFPSRQELLSSKVTALHLPSLDPDLQRARYGVVLSSDFWELLQSEERLLVPMDLMRHFVNKPTGWDYAIFLVYRCTRARSASKIQHETLMSLFKDNPRESDNQAIRRLLKYHEQVMRGTDGRLNAVLEQAGHFLSSGGRPKERWVLRIRPSKRVVHSGKKGGLFAPSDEAN